METAATRGQQVSARGDAGHLWVTVAAAFSVRHGEDEKAVRDSAEFLVDAKNMGLAERTVRALLSNKEQVVVTSCRRKFVTHILWAKAAEDETIDADEFLSYEAQTEATDEKGRKSKRVYFVTARSFAEAFDVVHRVAVNRREWLLQMVERPKMIIVYGGEETSGLVTTGKESATLNGWKDNEN